MGVPSVEVSRRLREKGRTVTATLRGGRDSMAAELFGHMPAAHLEVLQGGLEVAIERLRAMG
ncbi:hypothetical protein E4N62_16030 [Streptomyces sp. MNU76]|uniref:hypothetical protein n=1 Tax=Streptomyces sp. MNU76 TaxID=2560026 RepID=UPI001E547E1D|nr:hypothetical protein [Streptomyces sp. MNU76]MCC9706645.1 hypothetical protein [Streptomyces sp. MNU76]